MRKNSNDFPALSREVIFIAQHESDAKSVLDDKIFKPENNSVRILLNRIYNRADADVHELLEGLKIEIDRQVHGLFRIKWTRNKLNPNKYYSWHVYGTVFMPQRGPRKNIGWVSLTVSYGSKTDPRLFGSFSPSHGGLDGLKKLAQRFKDKKLEVHLISEERAKYAFWDGGDTIVWFDDKLTLKTGHDELNRQMGQATRQFFKVIKPMVKKLVAR